jgi:hypothetical protein
MSNASQKAWDTLIGLSPVWRSVSTRACPRSCAPQVAALLLKEYRDSFRGSPLAATWGYLKIWAQDSLPANPLVTHETGEPGAEPWAGWAGQLRAA